MLPAPDYVSDTTSVYTNIAKWILEDTNDLMLLAMGLPADPELGELPSWAPSLSSPSFETNYFRRRLRCLDTYDCARGIECLIQFVDPDILCLQGVPVDEVADVAKQEFASDDTSLHASLLRDWRDFASSCNTNESCTDDVFYETLIAGCSHQSSEEATSFPAATPSDISLCKEMISRLTSERSFADDASKLIATRQAHHGACLDRILFRTKAGRLGLANPSLRKGDELWIIGGGSAPFVVRRTMNDLEYPTYQLVGHAYVSGIMKGEAVNSKTLPRPCRLV